jgi:hypothetical protein
MMAPRYLRCTGGCDFGQFALDVSAIWAGPMSRGRAGVWLLRGKCELAETRQIGYILDASIIGYLLDTTTNTPCP